MKTIYTKILFLLFFSIISLSVFSQTGTIRGFVYDKKTGEPIPFANVYFKGDTKGTTTTMEGYFVLSKVKPGDYNLCITFLGYDSIMQKERIKANEILSRKFYLTEKATTLQAVNIVADRMARKTETRTSVVKVTPKKINAIPSIGGQADLAQYIQVIPGVIFTGDQGGQLYIRGGSPIQNKVLLDGMIVYNPFHSIGLFSVFDTDILRSADVYTGGFGAKYGGRVSSVMDIRTREGNNNRFAGVVSAGTFGSKVTLEGPLRKIFGKPFKNMSFILSAKNSYLKETSKELYSYANKDGLPFNYLDLYGKLSVKGKKGSTVNLFGFNFDDRVDKYRGIADFNWKSHGGGANFLIIPSSTSSLINFSTAYSSYKIAMKDNKQREKYNKISGFNMNFTISSFYDKVEVSNGVEIKAFRTDLTIFNGNNKVSNIENTTEISGFSNVKYTVNKLILEPGLRIQYYASLSNFSLEPRLSAKYLITDWLRVKLAAGIYSQNLISASSNRDVVNLFTGFIAGPENLPSEFNGKKVTHKLQKANHLVLGLEVDANDYITFNIEGYVKDFTQLSDLNNQRMFNESQAPLGASPLTYKEFVLSDGLAKGFDVSMKIETKKFYLWTIYALGYVNRRMETTDGSLMTYDPHFDRRHNVNVLATYKVGDLDQWEFSLRWNYGSGFPFTQIQGVIEKDGLATDLSSNVFQHNGNEKVIYSDDYNGSRLPSYHRLDASVKKTFFFGANTNLTINASVTNIYDQKNIFYYDQSKNTTIYQLPIMPSLGMTFRF
ncbi:MAG: carboxypeptidase-like regulatory domain-containing protein [Hyphomicrobiales bacterium]